MSTDESSFPDPDVQRSMEIIKKRSFKKLLKLCQTEEEIQGLISRCESYYGKDFFDTELRYAIYRHRFVLGIFCYQ